MMSCLSAFSGKAGVQEVSEWDGGISRLQLVLGLAIDSFVANDSQLVFDKLGGRPLFNGIGLFQRDVQECLQFGQSLLAHITTIQDIRSFTKARFTMELVKTAGYAEAGLPFFFRIAQQPVF